MPNINYEFVCICGKGYLYQSGLCAHKRRCSKNPDKIIENLEKKLVEAKKEQSQIENNFISVLEKQVMEKDKQLNEVLPKVGNSYTFNMNNFLNEQCKDAMTMEDFVNTIAITLENLHLVKEKGISTGISNLIIDNINKLSLQERPIHCSDKKREILYVKKKNWEKDTNKENTQLMIDHICKKHVQSLGNLVDDQNIYLDLMKTCTANLNNKKVLKDLCETVYINDEKQDGFKNP